MKALDYFTAVFMKRQVGQAVIYPLKPLHHSRQTHLRGHTMHQIFTPFSKRDARCRHRKTPAYLRFCNKKWWFMMLLGRSSRTCDTNHLTCVTAHLVLPRNSVRDSRQLIGRLSFVYTDTNHLRQTVCSTSLSWGTLALDHPHVINLFYLAVSPTGQV